MALRIDTASSVGGVIADRRLCLTADHSRVVEADDPRAAFLLAPPGTEIPPAIMARCGLSVANGKIVLPDQKAAEPAVVSEAAAAPKPKKKA